jgi:DNA polymerase sigma
MEEFKCRKFQDNVLKGGLSSKTATKLVREWIDMHEAELEKNKPPALR